MIDNPAKLPEIDIVEIVSLRGIFPNRVEEYMQNTDGAKVVKVSGDSARIIAELWRRLPEEMSKRCHTPPFGLRFYKDKKLILQVSICWICNNIYGDENGNEFDYAFEGNAQISQKLLAICESLFES